MNIKDMANLIVESSKNNRISSVLITSHTNTTATSISTHPQRDEVYFRIGTFGKEETLVISMKDKRIQAILKDEFYNTNIIDYEDSIRYKIESKVIAPIGWPSFILKISVEKEDNSINNQK